MTLGVNLRGNQGGKLFFDVCQIPESYILGDEQTLFSENFQMETG